MKPATSNVERIQRTFFPYAERTAREAREAGARFAYYTTANTAVKILKAKQIWLRNTLAMNDYREFDHGMECLTAARESEAGKRFDAILNKCFEGLADEVNGLFKSWLHTIEYETYMLCLSRHLPAEDAHGRLSMWRAYGENAGVALVLNGTALYLDSHALGVYASPVAYLSPDNFKAEMLEVVERISNEIDFVQSLGREEVRNIVFHAFRYAALCTKHPGFHEEEEWRVIASPRMIPSKFLIEDIEVVRGAPQTVVKLCLQNHLDEGVSGFTIPELLDRVIIGPCEYSVVTVKALHRLLSDAGVSNPETRITLSGIPLRTP